MSPIIDCIPIKPFYWTQAAELAFRDITIRLTSTPILVLLNFNVPFELHCDASKIAIGAPLSLLENLWHISMLNYMVPSCILVRMI